MTTKSKSSRTAKANGQARRGSRELSDNARLKEFEKLGPFEIKDFVQKVASKSALESSLSYLNAGRGNPNWVATEPREAFFLLGQFAITESKRVLDLPPGVGGMPKASGIADRLEAWLTKHNDMPGAPFLQAMVPWAVKKFSFDRDAFVHELVDSIIGDHYPVPDRMLVHNERIVHEYLEWAMCGNPRPKGKFKIYAVEGGTAAMCYIFKSLKANRLLNPGDTIALGVPIFTPYLEMAHLEDYDLHYVEIHAKQEDRFQYPDEEIKKLLDPNIKAFFIVNPGNPFAVALSPDTIRKIGAVLKKRPDLILLTDDVYGTFVPGFRSLMGEFPKNTIGVYSYSKYFGCTGWRLGTIAVHEDNIFDEMIAAHPEPTLKQLDKRYGGLTLEPRKLAFIDRIVADSRDIALNHTAGLSLPQQVMMTLFSLSELMDEKKIYQKACIGICKQRVQATIEGLDIEVGPNQYFDYYYGLIDFEFFARKYLGEEVVKWMKENVHPLDIVFRLAEDHGIVLLNGGGFAAPDWSVRISFANLENHVYDDIGRAVRAIARGYRQAYEAATGKSARQPRRERNADSVTSLCCCHNSNPDSGEPAMTRRTSLRKQACAVLALGSLLIGNAALAQRESEMDVWMTAPSDLSLAVTQPAPVDTALTSEEQGRTSLDESFSDFREWRLNERREALKDTKFEFNFRTFYFDRSDFSGAEKQAWAIGGWAGVKTGYFLDHIAFGLTAYTSQPIYAPKDRDGTTLLQSGQEGYSALGEFYAEIRIIDDLTVSIGAKGYDTPFINRNDTRMTPNTFEAVVLQGRTELGGSSSDINTTTNGIGPSGDGKETAVPTPTPAADVPTLKYGAGYFYQIKERNDNQFVSMAIDAGAHVERGVWTAGAIYEKGKFSIGAIDYYSQDIINIAYGQTGFQVPLSDKLKLKLAAQYVDQGSVGENLLQNHSFSGHQFGFKVDLPVEKALFTVGFTHAWGNANLQNPWSGYPGYTSVQVQDFNRAGESAFLLRAGYDFPWVDGLSAYALAVFGTDPDAATQFRQNEYDINAQWAPTKGLLKNLSLRLRYGVVEQFGGDVDNLTDFRAICNYAFKF